MGLLYTIYIVHLYYFISATVVKYGGTLTKIEFSHCIYYRNV